MEKDYFAISQAESEELDALAIPYRWRDSCVEFLKEFRQCRQEFRYTGMLRCRELEHTWLNCQVEREREILSIPDLKPVPLELRKDPRPKN